MGRMVKNLQTYLKTALSYDTLSILNHVNVLPTQILNKSIIFERTNAYEFPGSDSLFLLTEKKIQLSSEIFAN